MEKRLRILVLLLFMNICFSQSGQVTIIGNMPQLYGGDYVSFSKPIGKYATSRFFIKSTDNALIENNKFTKTIEVSSPGIINIYEKPFSSRSSARFFAEPGDTIYIERYNSEIVFKGKNAIINKMYSDIKISPLGFNSDVYEIFKNNKSYNAIILKINEKENEYIKFYNELYNKKEITMSCLNYTKIMMEQSIDITFLGFAKDEKLRNKEKFKITKLDADKLVEYFNKKYTPYKEENLKSLIFYSLIAENASYKELKAIINNKQISRFWNKYDDIFKSKMSNFGVVDYIEFGDYKEMYIGSYFLDLINSYNNDKSINYKDLISFYKVFAEKFPNSSYIIPLSECIMNIAYNNLKEDVPSNTIPQTEITIGSLAVYDKTLKSFDSSIFAKSNQTFIDALIEKFPNQDLFIDFWATFCSPCIKQFSYNADLHAFLDTKKIKTLYLSVDKEDDKLKWEKFIDAYHLTGYHFLADDKYRDKFINPFGAYIPMYFIYNSKTKELKELKGQPSEKDKFYEQISNTLNE